MPRIDLQVPFTEKEAAKRLGARWDASRRTWYVPDGVDSTALKKWLPEPHPPNVRSLAWDLVSAPRECWRCGVVTRVFAIALPPGHEALIVEDDPADDRWERGECSVLLSYVDHVPRNVALQLNLVEARYRVDYSHTTNSFYWMNHCEPCDAKLGDFETVEEPGTFYQLGPGLDQCKLTIESYHHIAEPFSGHCSAYVEVC